MFIPNLPPLNYLVQNGIIEEKLVTQEKNMVLNESEVRQKLVDFPGWITNGQSLSQTFKFDNFIQAIDFVNKLVAPAERAGHHPDISISYNKVTIHLTTHDAGGITQQDFNLAWEIDQIAQKF